MMNENNKQLCVLCQNCQSSNNEGSASETSESCVSKCQQWLESCSLNDETRSESSCGLSSSIFERADTADGDFYQNGIIYDRGVLALSDLQKLAKQSLPQSRPSKDYSQVMMYKCKKVLVGDVIKVDGPIYINQSAASPIQEIVTNKLFVNEVAKREEYKALNVVKRENWCMRDPIESHEYLKEPAKFVVILDTQTLCSFTREGNVMLAQQLQDIHIDEKRWNDIAYNFLIGCDSRVYEGRGWGTIGAHTGGYNSKAVGIAFIGTFDNNLPTPSVLDQGKSLIKYGVDIGVIDPDYKLYAHRQIRPQSVYPGEQLFKEIQFWDHWCDHSRK
ncbi:peptidoglycan-recognition protein LE-like isoform X1 [Photinus pyralis]|uniref:peptidoglycan-recognition protein LE-like isoform X1 n=1 Tax=Photinus pyralis TaxID=7054 RepID=UPI001267117E|nr:peptidoglycan-recognition protein LE-like isoform X1 [Photinus pyralis]